MKIKLKENKRNQAFKQIIQEKYHRWNRGNHENNHRWNRRNLEIKCENNPKQLAKIPSNN